MRPQRLRRVVLPISRWRRVWLVVAVVAAALVLWAMQPRDTVRGAPIGLFTTLPILWSEAPDIAAQLNDPAPPHWARRELEARGDIVPLDTLAAAGSASPLASLSRLVIAQPRPLSPQENVALDAWVRGGGRLLLVADPALTQHSDFPLGDPRRPQAVALLSPILARWGLELTFDDAQPFGERMQAGPVAPLPVNLAGRWRITPAPAGGGQCRTLADGLVAICTLGAGRVVAVADAAALEPGDPDGTRRKALGWLLDEAQRDR